MTFQRSALVASGKVYQTRGISRRVAQINISAIKEMPLIASKVGGCVSLGQGIPSFPTPPHIVEAVYRRMREDPDAGKYTLGPGLPELREAVAAHLSRQIGRTGCSRQGNLHHGRSHGSPVGSGPHRGGSGR